MGPRFNGVEDSARRGIGRSPDCPLQWGHALMAWKTQWIIFRLPVDLHASMGPRFNGVEDLAHVDF